MGRVKRLSWMLVQTLWSCAGIDAFPKMPGYHYVPDYYGRSASKRIDIRTLTDFNELANQAIRQGRTLLYYDRLYIIYQVLSNLRRLFPTGERMNIVEVGVYRGGTSHFIASTARVLGLSG